VFSALVEATNATKNKAPAKEGTSNEVSNVKKKKAPKANKTLKSKKAPKAKKEKGRKEKKNKARIISTTSNPKSQD